MVQSDLLTSSESTIESYATCDPGLLPKPKPTTIEAVHTPHSRREAFLLARVIVLRSLLGCSVTVDPDIWRNSAPVPQG
jgi:hypothetical protein